MLGILGWRLYVGPPKYLTEAEVKVLISEELKPYHRQNLDRFDTLFAAMNELNGSVGTAKWILGFLIVVMGVVVAIVKR